jgi:hypothetical protein
MDKSNKKEGVNETLFKIIEDIYQDKIASQADLFVRIDKLAEDYMSVISNMTQKEGQSLLDACKHKSLADYDEEKLKQHLNSKLEKLKKQEAELQKQLKEQMQQNVEDLFSSDSDKQRDAKKAIESELAGKNSDSTADPVAKTKPYLWKDYEHDIDAYNPEADFKPKLFTDPKNSKFNLPFPNGTLSVIGARTSRGKTTALVTLALEAIEEKKRKCLFITLEMTGRQLFNKLVLLKAYSTAKETTKRLLKELDKPASVLRKIIKDRKTEQESTIKNPNIGENSIIAASLSVKKEIDSGTLTLLEGHRLTQKQIIAELEKAEKGTLVLIDYLQRVPEDVENNGKRYDGYMRIKQISNALVKATIKSEVITICGAQFNRTAGQEDDTKKDKLDDTSFRESGDIEQDAHNAVGLGWAENTKQNRRHCKILKARESGGTGAEFEIEFNGAYSYMENIGKDAPKDSKTTKKKRSSEVRKQLGF